MSFTPDLVMEPAKRGLRISRPQTLFILTGVLFLLLCGQLIFPLWLLGILPLGIVVGIYLLKDDRFAFFTFLVVATIIQLKSSEGGVVTGFVAIVGGILTLLTLAVPLKKIFWLEKYSLRNNEHFLFLLYFLWFGIIGLLNVFFLATTMESWYRDLLVICPLLVIPNLFLKADLTAKSDQRWYYGTMLVVWIICFIASIVNLRSSFLEATYLYQVSHHFLNGLNGPFMLFVFFHLYLFETKKRKQKLFFIGILISIGAIFLTHNRTMWVLTPFALFLTLFFIGKVHRKKALKLAAVLLIIFVATTVLVYSVSSFTRVLVKAYFAYFLTSSNLKTDASLNGRYIEWQFAWEAIKSSPIIGYGAGGSFRLYNWFGGWFYQSFYIHNAYLGILQKAGIVGFIFLYSSYIGFLKKGWALLRLPLLSNTERAILRGGITTLLLLLGLGYTANIFGHRDVLLYIGTIWGYIIYIERITAAKQTLRLQPNDTYHQNIYEL